MSRIAELLSQHKVTGAKLIDKTKTNVKSGQTNLKAHKQTLARVISEQQFRSNKHT